MSEEIIPKKKKNVLILLNSRSRHNGDPHKIMDLDCIRKFITYTYSLSILLSSVSFSPLKYNQKCFQIYRQLIDTGPRGKNIQNLDLA